MNPTAQTVDLPRQDNHPGGAATPTLPGSVRLEDGPGGLARVVVTTSAASAVVYLQGAHVTSWVPAGQDDVLWVSGRSAFAPGAPIRGGVPVCYPWFGPHPTDGTAPLHGFARTAVWELESAEEHDGVVQLAFTLDTATVPAADIKAPALLRYTVNVGAELGLALEVANRGPAPLVVEESFHTYLAVGDVRRASIRGLEGVSSLDRLTGEQLPPAGDALTLRGETDRLLAQPGVIRVDDPAGARSITVRAQDSANAVVWNPGPAKAAAMPDFGDDEWTGMLCVETCNVADARVTIAPGASHTMAATLSVAPPA
ncbi:D-hexose-6-phosphate mutarotase [Tessaracoccus sp. G1721]